MISTVTETSRSRVRSQDDAAVGYYYERSENDSISQQYGNKKWAIGDDNVVIQVIIMFLIQKNTILYSYTVHNIYFVIKIFF